MERKIKEFHDEIALSTAIPQPDNFRKVDEELYRSAMPTSKSQIQAIRDRYGIRTVICLHNFPGETYEPLRKWVDELGMFFVWIPMSGLEKPSLSSIKRVLGQFGAGEKFLVHCKHGKDRTGIICAAYRILKQGWTVERATDEMIDLGHSPLLWWWDEILERLG